MNGGICHDLVGDYSCSCPAGAAGQFCEINEDDCFDAACHHGGTCVDKVRPPPHPARSYVHTRVARVRSHEYC